MSALAAHTIDRIETRTLTRRYPRHIGWNARWGSTARTLRCRPAHCSRTRGAGMGILRRPEEKLQQFVGEPGTDSKPDDVRFRQDAGTVTVEGSDVLGQPGRLAAAQRVTVSPGILASRDFAPAVVTRVSASPRTLRLRRTLRCFRPASVTFVPLRSSSASVLNAAK